MRTACIKKENELTSELLNEYFKPYLSLWVEDQRSLKIITTVAVLCCVTIWFAMKNMGILNINGKNSQLSSPHFCWCVWLLSVAMCTGAWDIHDNLFRTSDGRKRVTLFFFFNVRRSQFWRSAVKSDLGKLYISVITCRSPRASLKKAHGGKRHSNLM